VASLSEFKLTVRQRREESTGRLWTIFRFETMREFNAFRYPLQVEERFDPGGGSIGFRIRGVGTSSTLMPSAGSAGSEHAYPDLSGDFRVTVAGAKRSGSFSLAVDGEMLDLKGNDLEDFVTVVIPKGVEVLRM
jgi:hypothetical protein